METDSGGRQERAATFEVAVRELHGALLEAWNHRDATAMAGFCTEDAVMVGFDGSQMNGRREIEAALRPIFADHPTAAYVSIVRQVKVWADDVVMLTAVAGMVPPGKDHVMPERNAVQSLVAVRHNQRWRVALFQNTPAAFDGRLALREALTAELEKVLRTAGTARQGPA
jgi:uncharacterized protein (TIGR02246 family)